MVRAGFFYKASFEWIFEESEEASYSEVETELFGKYISLMLACFSDSKEAGVAGVK